MNYPPCLKPTWRTRALETSLIWKSKVVLVLNLELVVISKAPYWLERPVFANCHFPDFFLSKHWMPANHFGSLHRVDHWKVNLQKNGFLAEWLIVFSQLPLQEKHPLETPYPRLYCYHGNKTPKHHCVCHHSWQLVSWSWVCLFVSFTKRVIGSHLLTWKRDFSHVQIKLMFIEWLGTRPSFDRQAISMLPIASVSKRVLKHDELARGWNLFSQRRHRQLGNECGASLITPLHAVILAFKLAI